jgi:hypothetical protein
MPSSGTWRCVALVTTDVSEECIASIIRVKRISELVTANAVLIRLILFNLMRETIRTFETLVPTRATRRRIPEDGILLYNFISQKI